MRKRNRAPFEGGFWTEVVGAAVDGVAVAVVEEVGAGVREWLTDRREAAAEILREKRKAARKVAREAAE